MTSKTDEAKFTEMINGMYNFYNSIPAKNDNIKNKLLIKITTLNMVIGIGTEKDISQEFYSELLNIAKGLDGIIFWGTRNMLDNNGRLILDLDGNSEVEDFIVTAHTSYLDSNLKITESGKKRKEQSEKILLSKSVPINKNLPVICGDEDAKNRNIEEIAKRAIALCIVAVKGECHATNNDIKDTNDLIYRIINQYGASEFFSKKEKEFIENDNPNNKEVINFAWCYEGYTVMLWALGYIKELEYPEKICDVPTVVKILQKHDSYNNFLVNSKLKSKSEILDAADLIYRYDWACVNARIKNESAPGGLDSGVVFERHRALNWLIRYMEQDWDYVTTDT
jgi:hypothetical protein